MKKILIILVLFLALLSFGAKPTFAAENFFQKTVRSIGNGAQRFYLRWIPGDKPGESVLIQAISATEQLKTAQVASEITADLLQDDQSKGNAKITIKGPAQLQPQVSGEMTQQEMNFSGEFTLQGTTLRLVADAKVAGNTFYFKLNQVPALPNVDLSAITGKWYKTTMEAAASTENTQLSTDQKEQLNAASMQLWKSAKAGTAQAVTKNDHSVYMVNVTIPNKAVEEYLSAVVEVQSQAYSSQSPDITSRIQSELRQNLNKIGDIKAVVWVDKSTFYVRHIEIPISYAINQSSNEEASFAPLAALSQINKAIILIKVDLDNFNEPIQFVEPTDALEAKDALAASFGKMMTPGLPSAEGTSELPSLTPAQRLQLQQLNSISPAQKQKYLDQLGQMDKLQ